VFAEVTITRSTKTVWDYLTATGNWQKWHGGALERVEPGWTEGASLVWEVGAPSELNGVVPGEAFRTTGQFMETAYRLEPYGADGCRVRVDFEPRGGASFSDGGRAHLTSSEKMLAQLKDCIEKETPEPASEPALAQPPQPEPAREVSRTPAPAERETPTPAQELVQGGKPARGKRWTRALLLTTAGLVVIAVIAAAWLSRKDISDRWFLLTQCERIDDGAEGYPRYRHERAGAIFARFEGVLFEELGVNAQSYPEYRHLRSDTVFVRLPGGQVIPKSGEEPADVGPFLIKKSPLSSQQWESALGPDENGLVPYSDLVDLGESLGGGRFGPALHQRYYALGKSWQPSTGTAVYPRDRAAPNEYGIVGLKHDPNLGDTVRPVLNLTRSTGAAVRTAEAEPASTAPGEPPSEKVAPEILEQEWTGLAAGSKVFSGDGKELTIAHDLAKLQVGLQVDGTGTSDSIFDIRGPTTLVGQDGQVVARLRVLEVWPSQGDVNQLRAIQVKGNQSVRIELQSKLTNLTELQSASPLFVEFPAHGWRLQVIALPERDVLFSKED